MQHQYSWSLFLPQSNLSPEIRIELLELSTRDFTWSILCKLVTYLLVGSPEMVESRPGLHAFELVNNNTGLSLFHNGEAQQQQQPGTGKEAPLTMDEEYGAAPDGGLKAWLVAAGGASVFFCCLGFAKSFGTFSQYYATYQPPPQDD
ncbi:hypothetical protein PG988_009154 [Apiospora saccharicola]